MPSPESHVPEEMKREVHRRAELAALRSVTRRLWGHVHTMTDPRTAAATTAEKESIYNEHVVSCIRILAELEEQHYQELLELFENQDPGFAARLDDRPDPTGAP